MLRNIKKSLKRAIIFLLILGGIFVIVVTVTNLTGNRLFSPRIHPVLIDSGSGYEIDDLFAISRALAEPKLDLVGITSVHCEFADHFSDSSIKASQKMHEELLQLFGQDSLPHPVGARNSLEYGEEIQPRRSPAAEFIIKEAHRAGKNNKLNIITLGALTNVASAVLIDPEIVPKIRVNMMGLKYDPKGKIWNKNEFNVRSDLDALDVLLNTSGLELYIMPATTSEALAFEKAEAEKYLSVEAEPWNFLMKQWNTYYPDKQTKIIRDLSIIEAVIDPELVKWEEALTPPENRPRTVKVYTYINSKLMIADFYAKVMKFNREGKR